MTDVKTLKREKVIDEQAFFIMEASCCRYNNLWTCEHPAQTGIKCEKVCDKFKHGKDL